MRHITVLGPSRPFPENERGYHFYRFLKLYPEVVSCEWRDHDTVLETPIKTDILIVFYANHLGRDALSACTYDALFLASYTDDETPSDTLLATFGNMATGFLLPYVPKTHACPLPIYPLPVHFQPQFRPIGYTPPLRYRPINAMFLGAATCYQGQYQQRKAWVQEIQNSGLSRCVVGLYDTETYPLSAIEATHLQHRYIGPRLHASLLGLSKIALTPAGNARWTYRHYESIAAQNVLISTDLEHYTLLVPIPTHATLFVEDHAQIANHIEQVLATIKTYETAVQNSKKELAQFLTKGQYDPKKKEPILRFMRYITHGS